MSVKQRLTAAIQTLPETISMEEAVERLYRIYKLKRQFAERSEQRHRPAAAAYDAVFAHKLPIPRFPETAGDDSLDLTGDDFVF